MPTLEDLRTYVLNTAQEETLTDEGVDALLNEALIFVAEKVLLPDLQTSDTVTTDATAAVDLPENYHRGLFGCAVSGQEKEPTLLTSFRQMLRRFPNIELESLNGEVTHVCVHEGKIWYHPVPAIPTVMSLRYYRVPTPLVEEQQVPEGIPTGLQRRLLGSYALCETYDVAEDDRDGIRPNTKRYDKKFKEALDELDTGFSRFDRGQPPPPRDLKAFS